MTTTITPSRRVAACLGALLCAGTAHADDAGSPWYAKALLGANTMSDVSFALSGDRPAATADTNPGSGYLFGGAVGYELSPVWALEAEFAYQNVDLDAVTLADGSQFGGGDYASTTASLSALWSFDAFGSPRVRTFLGAGAAWLTEVDVDSGPVGSYSGDSVGLLLQAGARYDLGRRFFVDAGVRYLLGGSVTLDDESGSGGRAKADYEPWSVTVGFGWRF